MITARRMNNSVTNNSTKRVFVFSPQSQLMICVLAPFLLMNGIPLDVSHHFSYCLLLRSKQ